MSIQRPIKTRIESLKKQYDSLKPGKESLLVIIDETEIPESVYNSNAIENSTLTLRETEKILLDMEVSRDISVREVFEAKNLARVIEYIRQKSQTNEINQEIILLLHQMLIGGIKDNIAGRFRTKGEYVRVGSYIAPPPEQVEILMESTITEYTSNFSGYFLENISKFHLLFENIHPFNDGNGRIGRVLISFQLQRLGFPMIIIRNKEKQKYYNAFIEYRQKKATKAMETIVSCALLESLHKRIAYMRGEKIISVADYARANKKVIPALLNAARRQTIPAFREKGVCRIGEWTNPRII
jgi:Fic family protein